MKIFFITIIFLFSLFIQLSSQPAKIYWKLSQEKFKEKDFVSALTYVDSLLNVMPGFAAAYYNRGIIKLNLMDFNEACSDIKIADSLGFNHKSQAIDYYCNHEKKIENLKKQFYPREKLIEENNYRPLYTRKDTLRGMLRPERTCFDVYFYDLNVRIIPRGKRITGSNDIYFHVKNNCSKIQIDLFENMRINSITWNNQPIEFTREYNAVFLKFPVELKTGSREMISVKYEGKPIKAPNPPWDGGFVWKREGIKRWVSVACEQLGASVWWPNKDHLSDKPDSMGINIEVPKKFEVISNGNLRQVKNQEDNYVRYEWFVQYPINNYNVTFYMANDYIRIKDTVYHDGKPLMVDHYVLPQNYEIASDYFKQTLEVINFYNDMYGPYPFWEDGFGQVESPFDGMEHQGAIAYGNDYGSDDARKYHNGKYDPIIVHEAAHEWWGNSISASDMAEIWLHESFATYSEILFLENKFDYYESLNELRKHFMMIHNFWPMVENFDVNENAFASNDVYMKGSAMLNNLRCTINDDKIFYAILKGFLDKYKYQVVSSNDFVKFVNEITGENYTPFFNKFLYEEKPPVLNYYLTKNKNGISFHFKWEGVENGFKMSFVIKDQKGKNIRLKGSTDWQSIELAGCETFFFYNQFTGFQGTEPNGFTYFWTNKK